ncbi:TetR/AcrR family transcriptional regulator [Actinomycetospora endophytica]|uniref:TetR/AcrR family transcriptional regulator n=1 Tax=Actinomycetospora endophytica TaxID=2291215 RepID=A0ABS8PDX2_9PSEU|nr:TetR/AcrR family transcriptional regulator [Actinomycetospora endophytica]MCD2196465.1 TetR/AcrR family transcriptional regulator [Actinomycetospora endophytica]
MTATDSPTGTDEAAGPGEGSARRRELLDAAYGWVLAHGLADMSLRPLAEAIGSSPRVLLYLFGSKDGLVRALLGRSRADQLRVLEDLPDDAGLDVVARGVWRWLAAHEHRPLLRLWLEAYSRSVIGEPGPWEGFAEDTVTDWDLLLAAHQPSSRVGTTDGAAERALLLAVLRGALLDLLATGDDHRTGAAVEAHLRTLSTGRRAVEGADGGDRDDG